MGAFCLGVGWGLVLLLLGREMVAWSVMVQGWRLQCPLPPALLQTGHALLPSAHAGDAESCSVAFPCHMDMVSPCPLPFLACPLPGSAVPSLLLSSATLGEGAVREGCSSPPRNADTLIKKIKVVCFFFFC